MISLRRCPTWVSYTNGRRFWRTNWPRKLGTEGPERKSTGGYPSAGVIVIGDEILKAQVKETNSFFACDLLYKLGVKVKKVSVISDDVHDIAREMQDFSNKYHYVIASGGIGPTHDDVTFQALAMAFEDELHYHPDLVGVVRDQFGYEDFSSPGYKMAHIPRGATLKYGTDRATGRTLRYPCIVLVNVHVFPGSPAFFEISFGSLCEELFNGNRSFAMSEIYIDASEESFADILTAVVNEFPSVSFGSYPEHSKCYRVRVTIESDNEQDTARAKERLCALLPDHILVQHVPPRHFDPKETAKTEKGPPER